LDDALQNKLTNRQVFIVFLLNILIDILAIHLSTSTRPVCDPLALTATYPGLKLITLALSTLHISETCVRGQLGVYIVGGENFSTNQIARNLIGREKFARTIKGARSPRIST
jgi:ABC-type bacteriocin/lantibiotic exporter with double-glycine peptidase domain